MKVLVVSINYAPEKVGIGRLTTELCEYLSSDMEVEVITTFPHYPQWKFLCSPALYKRENINGVKITRVSTILPSKPGIFWQRFLFHLSFTLGVIFTGIFIIRRRFDVIVYFSPPLETAVSILSLVYLKRSRFILVLQDILPDLAIRLGILKNSILISLARLYEKFIYRKAGKIVVLNSRFRENLLGKNVDENKVKIIPNWVDVDMFGQPVDGIFREKYCLKGKFLVVYSGSMGKKQKLGVIIKIAELFDSFDDVMFVIAGEGERAQEIEDLSKSKRNIIVLPLQEDTVFKDMLMSADVFIIPQSEQIGDMVVPSKMCMYMAAGKPLLVCAHKESILSKYVRSS